MQGLTSSEYVSVIFFALWLIWFCFEMFFSWIAPFGRSRGRITFNDKGSTLLVIIGSIGCITFMAYLSVRGVLMLPEWASYIGLLLFAAGMCFRFWAILTIGRYFSPIVGIYREHKLVTNGPYRYVRHPSYTGALAMLFGYGLILGSLIGSVVTLAVMFFVYIYRIKTEEAGLMKRFGKEYSRYAKGKSMIIPYLA